MSERNTSWPQYAQKPPLFASETFLRILSVMSIAGWVIGLCFWIFNQ